MAEVKSDIEIARAAKKKPIQDIGAKLGIPTQHLEPYGHDKAKVSSEFIKSLANKPDEVVLTRGDEDLGAGNRVRTVGIRNGFRAQDADIGTRLRFGQAHRSRAGTRKQQRQEALLLLRRTVPFERVHRAV